jgi:hypothetical protein
VKRLSLIFILLCAHAVAFATAKPSVSKAMADACAKIVAHSETSDPRAVMAHAIGQGLDMARLRERLEELSGAKPMPDGFVLEERGSDEGRMIARARIFEMLRDMGLRPQYENFDKGSNVIAEIRGTKKPTNVLELAAHYDSVGNPGADDNGSGVALLLELAQYMRQFKPETTIRFVFNDLEETGHYGAIHHTKKILEDKVNEVMGTIVIDTIGWGAKGGKYYLAVVEVGEIEDQETDEAYAAQELFAAEMFYLLGRIGIRDGVKFSPETKEALPGTADHGPYWNAGIPAILIAAPYETGFINPGYHRDSDTVAGMNWDYYRLVSQSITELVAFKSGAHVKLNDDEIAKWVALENPQIELNLAILKQSLDRDPALPARPKPKPIFTWPNLSPKPSVTKPGPVIAPPPPKEERSSGESQPAAEAPAEEAKSTAPTVEKTGGLFGAIKAFFDGLTGN